MIFKINGPLHCENFQKNLWAQNGPFALDDKFLEK